MEVKKDHPVIDIDVLVASRSLQTLPLPAEQLSVVESQICIIV